MCISEWKAQRGKFRNIADSMLIPIIEIDANHTVHYANTKALETLMIG